MRSIDPTCNDIVHLFTVLCFYLLELPLSPVQCLLVVSLRLWGFFFLVELLTDCVHGLCINQSLLLFELTELLLLIDYLICKLCLDELLFVLFVLQHHPDPSVVVLWAEMHQLLADLVLLLLDRLLHFVHLNLFLQNVCKLSLSLLFAHLLHWLELFIFNLEIFEKLFIFLVFLLVC